MVSPATALVPVRETRTIRSVSLVLPPVVSASAIGAASSLTAVIAGALGAVVSTVVSKLADAGEALPARSITLALIV